MKLNEQIKQMVQQSARLEEMSVDEFRKLFDPDNSIPRLIESGVAAGWIALTLMGAARLTREDYPTLLRLVQKANER